MVRTLQAVRGEIEALGHIVAVIAPDQFASVPCPSYPEIRLALARGVGDRIAAFAPDAIHIATEGPLGIAARAWCLKRRRPFTTAYHTQFPDYLSARTRLPAHLFWRYIRWFHEPAHSVLVSTPTLARQMHARGILQTRLWGRGVDTALFRPEGTRHPDIAAMPGPVQLYVGRVAVEKNLSAFLDLDLPGTKAVIGDGPARAAFEARYPEARFLGTRSGAELAAAYRAADVFVFPSRTDTFGLVMIEALACGVPVAAFPVPGPADVLGEGVGRMDDNLGAAIAGALMSDRGHCAAYGAGFSWAASARQFLASLAPVEIARAA